MTIPLAVFGAIITVIEIREACKNTFFLKKEAVLRKKQKKCPLIRRNMVQVHGGAKASAEGGRYKNTQIKRR